METQKIPGKITLGLHRTAKQYRRALKEAGVPELNEWTKEVLDEIPLVGRPRVVSLAVRSVEDLGLDNGTPLEVVYGRAARLGYGLCPAEVGPALRLAFMDQRPKAQLYIGMEPVADLDGNMQLFILTKDDEGADLHTYGFSLITKMDRLERFVFLAP